MGKFFVSDTHFDHQNIIQYTDRPFSSVEEMNEALIDNWNKTVGRRDEVCFLGDFAFNAKRDRVDEILGCLNGQIVFILGNHDNEKVIRQCKLSAVYSYREIRHNKRKLCLFHYPIWDWNQRFKGAIHLFGHVHGNLDGGIWGRSFDVGVDSQMVTNEYRPVAVEEIMDIAEQREVPE